MNYFMLLFPACLWGSIGLFFKDMSISSTYIALFRTVFASLTLIIIYFFRKNKIDKIAFKNNLLKLTFSGACIGFNWVALFEAYKLTSVSVATVVYYLAPVIVIACSTFMFKEKLSIAKIIGLISALVGMTFVSFSAGVGDVSFNGIFIAFIGAVLYAFVMLCNKTITEISGFNCAMIELAISSLILVIYTIFIIKEPYIAPTNFEFTKIIIVGVLHTGIAYGMYFTAVQKVPAQTSALSSFADPLSALVLSSVFLNESLTSLQIIGAILIIGGAMLAEMYQYIVKK